MAHGASDADSWVDLSPGSALHIGAYFPASTVERAETVTVFWNGQISSESVRNILRGTEMLYDGSPDYRAFLIAYGAEREELKSAGGSLADGLSPAVDAIRAEFSGSIGDLTLWATLSSATDGGSEGLDENIGVCVSPTFFQSAKGLIGYAILETTDGMEQVVDASLDRLSDLIRPEADPEPDVVVAM